MQYISHINPVFFLFCFQNHPGQETRSSLTHSDMDRIVRNITAANNTRLHKHDPCDDTGSQRGSTVRDIWPRLRHLFLYGVVFPALGHNDICRHTVGANFTEKQPSGDGSAEHGFAPLEVAVSQQ